MEIISSSSLPFTNPSSSSSSSSKLSTKITLKLSPHFETKTQISTKTKHYKKRPLKPNKYPEENAFPESLPLHTKNPSSIYKDIQRFARQGKLKECFTILDYLYKQGIPVNPTTFTTLIVACIRSKSLSDGRQVHTYIRVNNLDDNEYLLTKLVYMYTSCGAMEDAERLFDRITDKQHVNVYPWNALLRGNVVRGGWRYGEVLDTYARMRELGVELNEYSYSCLIKSFAGASAVTQGLKLHARLIKNGFASGSIVLQTSLIDMYFKCGNMKLAHRVFQEIGDRDIVVWGAMIAGFAHNRLYREALEYLRWMLSEGVEPNPVIITSILAVIGEVSGWKLGREVHGYVLKNISHPMGKFIHSGLIDMYCKCKDLGSGRKVFYGSKERSAVCWTSLMSGYASNGRLDMALRSISWMQQEGAKPDVVTIATVLPVCGKLKALKQGKEIHCYVVKNRYLPNVSIVTSLMVMYSTCGSLDYSCKLFDELERKNVISWTAMIDSYLKNHCLDEALTVFRSMQLSKHRPDAVTISRILNACSESGVLRFGKELHGHLLKRGFESIPFVCSEVVKMYGRCGELEKARLVFDTCSCKKPITQTAIIEAYGYNNKYQDALDLFHRMRGDGFSPNHFTFGVILSICDRAGFVAEGRRIFNTMTRKYNIKPSEDHYSSIIGLLTRVGCTDEAQNYIRMRSSMVQA